MKTITPALAAVCAAALIVTALPAFAAGRYDAALRFRVLRTPHFTIYYHQGEAGMAQRLAGIAEAVREDLATGTGLDAPRHTHVVLVDQSDIANGWSTPVPYNLIEIAAVPPPPSSFIGHHDDWLRVVFAHEYAHVLHLDRAGGVMKGARWVLGRNPATFSNLFLPQWQVEGFATWAESAATGLGRVHAADAAAVVSAMSAGGFASIDRAGGGIVDWPSGHTPYLLGGTFDQAIASRYSTKALGDLARDTARRLPFFGGGAYPKVLGTSAGALWRDVFAASPAPPAGAAEIRRLTRDGFAVSGPRLVRLRAFDGDRTEVVYYSSRGPHRFPDIRMVGLTGGPAVHVASRFDGQAVSSDGRWLYFDQLEFDGPSAIVADLYARHLDSGRVRRLSHGLRLTDPDIDASGAGLVAVRARDGQKRLTIWRVVRSGDGAPAIAKEPERVLGSAGCQYASPRWSPDAARIAAVRQCPGSLPAVVEVEALDGSERVLASGGRNLTPAWSPDGMHVLFASDREDGRFKLFAARAGAAGPAAEATPILDAPGGVMWPDVSADGRTVVFTSLTDDGWDVFAAPLAQDPGREADPAAVATKPAEGTAPPPAVSDAGGATGSTAPPSDSYSPWRTLLPRAWSPLITVNGDDVEIGATAGASDVLGYHEYSASATWRVAGQESELSFDAPPVSWNASYAYHRWRPSFLLSAWQAIETVSVSLDGSAETYLAEERGQGIFAGVVVPWRRIRIAQNWFAGVNADQRSLPAAAAVPDRLRNALRAGWSLASSREYGYSISPEDGLWMAVNLERVTPHLGADGTAFTLTGDWRAFVPGFRPHQVVAMRLGVASSTGDAGMTRSFDLGGTGLARQPFAMGQRAIGLLRGLPPNDRSGASMMTASVDYRAPLARVERGIGTWPFFLRDLHGALFADIGSAGSALDALPEPAFSTGAEIASRLTLGYSWNLNVAAGAAWVHDPARDDRPDRFALFVRTGYAF